METILFLTKDTPWYSPQCRSIATSEQVELTLNLEKFYPKNEDTYGYCEDQKTTNVSLNIL
jgi:hypothetical protein